MRAAAVLLGFSAWIFASLLDVPRADACSPPLPALSGSYPAKGAATYPAGAPIFLQGYGVGNAPILTATVDGKPASVAIVGDLPRFFVGFELSLAPAPAPGALVTLTGDACGGGAGAPTCPVELAWEAGPPDTAAPAAPTAVTYDVHDYVDFRSSGGDCQSDSQLALWVSIPPPVAAAEAEFWGVEVRLANETEPFHRQALLRRAEASTLAIRLAGDRAAAAAKGQICVGVVAFDVSRNTSSRVETCAPCHLRVDPPGAGGGGPFSPPDQPTWTAADLFPGGACVGSEAGGSGGSGTGGSLGGGGQLGGSAGASSGLAPVTPSSDEGGCALAARSAGDTRLGVAEALLLGALGLLGARLRRGRRSAP